MDKLQAVALIGALDARGIDAEVDEFEHGDRVRTTVVICDTRDTVWQEGDWSWGPNYEHTLHQDTAPDTVAEQLFVARHECPHCIAVLERIR